MDKLVKLHLGQHKLLGIGDGSIKNVLGHQLVLVSTLRADPGHLQLKLLVLRLILRHVDAKKLVNVTNG